MILDWSIIGPVCLGAQLLFLLWQTRQNRKHREVSANELFEARQARRDAAEDREDARRDRVQAEAADRQLRIRTEQAMELFRSRPEVRKSMLYGKPTQGIPDSELPPTQWERLSSED